MSISANEKDITNIMSSKEIFYTSNGNKIRSNANFWDLFKDLTSSNFNQRFQVFKSLESS